MNLTGSKTSKVKSNSVGVCYNSVTLGFVDVWQAVTYIIKYAELCEVGVCYNSVTLGLVCVWQYVTYIIQYAGLCDVGV